MLENRYPYTIKVSFKAWFTQKIERKKMANHCRKISGILFYDDNVFNFQCNLHLYIKQIKRIIIMKKKKNLALVWHQKSSNKATPVLTNIWKAFVQRISVMWYDQYAELQTNIIEKNPIISTSLLKNQIIWLLMTRQD